jgi:hypothetical protein
MTDKRQVSNDKGAVCHYPKDVIPGPEAQKDGHIGSYPNRTWWNVRIAMNPGYHIKSARIAGGIKVVKS